MVLFASPSQKHHHFPIFTQVLQFHYSFLRPCLGRQGRGLRMPPGEKSGACARAVSFEGTRQPDDQSDLGLTPSQFPRQLPALGCADLRSFYHPTWATLHHCTPLRHWHWPAFASCGFTPSLHLGDTLGRTTPACLISSQREELLGGRKQEARPDTRIRCHQYQLLHWVLLGLIYDCHQ